MRGHLVECRIDLALSETKGGLALGGRRGDDFEVVEGREDRALALALATLTELGVTVGGAHII